MAILKINYMKRFFLFYFCLHFLTSNAIIVETMVLKNKKTNKWVVMYGDMLLGQESSVYKVQFGYLSNLLRKNRNTLPGQVRISYTGSVNDNFLNEYRNFIDLINNNFKNLLTGEFLPKIYTLKKIKDNVLYNIEIRNFKIKQNIARFMLNLFRLENNMNMDNGETRNGFNILKQSKLKIQDLFEDFHKILKDLESYLCFAIPNELKNVIQQQINIIKKIIEPLRIAIRDAFELDRKLNMAVLDPFNLPLSTVISEVTKKFIESQSQVELGKKDEKIFKLAQTALDKFEAGQISAKNDLEDIARENKLNPDETKKFINLGLALLIANIKSKQIGALKKLCYEPFDALIDISALFQTKAHPYQVEVIFADINTIHRLKSHFAKIGCELVYDSKLKLLSTNKNITIDELNNILTKQMAEQEQKTAEKIAKEQKFTLNDYIEQSKVEIDLKSIDLKDFDLVVTPEKVNWLPYTAQ